MKRFTFFKYVPGLKQKIESRLISEYDKYPSIFNAGNLHIQKAINYIKEYKLDVNNVIVDIGAARGDISLLFAKHFPESFIYSYEPIKQSYSLLCENVNSFTNITPVNKALGSTHATMEINIANRITSSSLFELNPANSQNFITENINLVSKEVIEVTTLDSENLPERNINLMKLDVQGFEIEALKGALNCLSRTYFVLVELSNHDYYKNGAKYFEVDEFLRHIGFELQTFIPSLREKNKILEWDSIYINKKLMK